VLLPLFVAPDRIQNLWREYHIAFRTTFQTRQVCVNYASQIDTQYGDVTRVSTDNSAVVELVHQWIERCVIDLALCPFASSPYRTGKVRVVVCSQHTESHFLELLEAELVSLLKDTESVETTLVVGQNVLADFLDFNDFLTAAESLSSIDDRDATIQIASFHPHYRFAGVEASDAGNYTNRAPFPIVQWLRTASVSKVVDAADTSLIPDKNIATLQSMRAEQLSSLFPWVKSE